MMRKCSLKQKDRGAGSRPRERKRPPWRRGVTGIAAAVVLAAGLGVGVPALAQVVSDFTVIWGDSPWVRIGDGRTVWRRTFDTGGREPSTAFLSLNVRGLTHTHVPAEVRLNGQRIGQIDPYSGGWATINNWHTQTISFPGSVLRSGSGGGFGRGVIIEPNVLEIRAAPLPDALVERGNRFDDFDVKSVICYFKQDA